MALRKARGESQVVFAKALGVTANCILDWERGRYTPRRVAEIALDALERESTR